MVAVKEELMYKLRAVLWVTNPYMIILTYSGVQHSETNCENTNLIY